MYKLIEIKSVFGWAVCLLAVTVKITATIRLNTIM